MEIMEKILAFIIGTIINIYILLILYGVVGLIRNEVAFKQRNKIMDAIHRYHIDCVYKNTDQYVDYADMEEYDDTMNRFWDFGYTRILPKDKFEIIKPYIEVRKKA